MRYLRRLTRSFIHDGERISYIHVYARPLGPERDSPLESIAAQEIGVEGIACVDDAARAAILALQVHEETASTMALDLARAWLRFVTYMQETDGRFANFILDQTGAKNLHGETSRTDGSWWNARALWAHHSPLGYRNNRIGGQRFCCHFSRPRCIIRHGMRVATLPQSSMAQGGRTQNCQWLVSQPRWL